MSETRPISEAPKDGSPVELQYGDTQVKAVWCDKAGHWVLQKPLVIDRLTDAQIGGYVPRRGKKSRSDSKELCVRPVGFRTAMVRAILDGRKVQERLLSAPMWLHTKSRFDNGAGCYLWVREAWAVGQHDVNDPADDRTKSEAVVHCASFSGEPAVKWRPSIHMPRHASRITLKVTDARVEPLQNITAQDLPREGIRGPEDVESLWQLGLKPLDAYAQLWDELHKRQGCAWHENPDVVALTFQMIRANIDDVIAGL